VAAVVGAAEAAVVETVEASSPSVQDVTMSDVAPNRMRNRRPSTHAAYALVVAR
jgi:hypothetical protein